MTIPPESLTKYSSLPTRIGDETAGTLRLHAQAISGLALVMSNAINYGRMKLVPMYTMPSPTTGLGTMEKPSEPYSTLHNSSPVAGS